MPRRLIVAAIAVFALLLIGLAGLGIPLHWDEAVYANGARMLVEGGPEGGFEIYRPVGMTLIGAPGVLAGGSEQALRALPVLMSIAMLIAFVSLGVRVGGSWATALACGGLLTSYAVVRRSVELMSDTSAALFMLLLIIVVIREVQRGVGARFLAAAPLAAAAFYVRYGSLLILAAIAVAAAVVFWRELVRAKLIVAATAALFLVCLVPHFAMSVDQTGSALGILVLASDVAGRPGAGVGFLDYVRFAPRIGPVLIVLVVIGCAFGVRLALNKKRDPDSAVTVFLWLAGLTHLLAVGLLFNGKPRYILLDLLLLSLVGAVFVSRRVSRNAAVAIAVSVAMFVAVNAAVTTYSFVRMADTGRVLVDAAAVIRESSGRSSCSVMTSRIPEIAWYSGCSTARFRDPPRPESMKGEHRYVLFVDRAKREPTRAVRDYLQPSLQLLAHIPSTGGAYGAADVYRLRNAQPAPK